MSGVATVAEALVETLTARGAVRIFGVPGGGGGLDVIDAARAAGMEFVLTGTETAAAIMAAVTAEITGVPGVALTAMGPGVLAAANGIAYARLERAPLLLVSDRVGEAEESFVSHQVVDHAALLAPISKASVRLRPDGAAARVAELLALAATPPQGPVHVDLPAAVARAAVTGAAEPLVTGADAPSALDGVDAARALLSRSRRPVLLVGMEAREVAPAVTRWARSLRCPVLTTYKAKGVVPDDDPLVVGHFTGAAAEGSCLEAADLVIFCGLDPVEIIPRRWGHEAPVLDLARFRRDKPFVKAKAAVVGPLDAAVRGLSAAASGSAWHAADIRAFKEGMRARLASPPGAPVTPQQVVEAAQAAAPADARITVDAGAHMIPVMAFWRAPAANRVLISNALSTMGFALPAAIASALAEPERPVVAFTGDGGLMMCLSELATAARLALDVTVVVFNDAALSLIDVKQRQRGLASAGVRYPRRNLAAVARAFGWRAWRVERRAALGPALGRAVATKGPALVDVSVDSAGYRTQLSALRG